MAEEEEADPPEEVEIDSDEDVVPGGGSSSSAGQPVVKRKRAQGDGHRYKTKMSRNTNLPNRNATPTAPDFDEAGRAAVEALHMCEEGFFSSVKETRRNV